MACGGGGGEGGGADAHDVSVVWCERERKRWSGLLKSACGQEPSNLGELRRLCPVIRLLPR
jgi:hypothetical protein